MAISKFTKEQLDQMLEEVASFSVDLEEDPTLPHLGTRYLQRTVAQCRQYTNRVMYYLQQTMAHEKVQKREAKILELNLDLKIKGMLADDTLVRKGPSIEDRKALAASFLKDEHEELTEIRVRLLDLEETIRILRMKYNDLQKTASDIKFQRQLIRDDKEAQLTGEEGYSKPQIGQDKSVSGGLMAPVSEPVDPKDLLDPEKRPDDLPEPKDAVHAAQIAEFLRSHPETHSRAERVIPQETVVPDHKLEPDPGVQVMSLDMDFDSIPVTGTPSSKDEGSSNEPLFVDEPVKVFSYNDLID